MTRHRRAWPMAGLLVGDWLALGLFVFLGQLEHDLLGEGGLPRLVATTVELALPWTVIATLMGAYRLQAISLWRFLGRTLNVWLVSAPLALLMRAWLQGQATIIVIFFAVTLGLAGAFLLGWRWLFYLWWARRLGQHGGVSSPQSKGNTTGSN